MPKTLTIVSHTHWDREWYQPFQEYRIRLVRLMDKLLDILTSDPHYRHFTLDGQTIILEDYLEIRPEREPEIRQLAQEKRLLIGPWYILPDEFLVGPEATIRNLMLGDRMARRFGPKMNVGYVPDPFGHTSQLPQILRGFGMDVACFWRGAGDVPTEFRWVAPDGSEVLVLHLRDSYSNAAYLPADEDGFVAAVRRIVDSLSSHSPTDHLLAMNGVDHMEPMPQLPALIAAAKARLPDVELRHGTLPQHVAAVRAVAPELEVQRGEMRCPQYAPLLPGVFSARMWIKQRNAAAEILLEKWAEPFSVIAAHLKPEILSLKPLVQQAWRYLIQNHPHDSICGCSIDQVHKEMDVRFDWAEQIGEEVTRQSLAIVAGAVDTASLETGEPVMPVMVFNPVAGPRTDVVTVRAQLSGRLENFTVTDETGQPVPFQILQRYVEEFGALELTRAEAASMIGTVESGHVMGHPIQEMHIERGRGKDEADLAFADVTLLEGGQPDAQAVRRTTDTIRAWLDDESVQRYRVRLHFAATVEMAFVASDVPGHGYRAFAIRPATALPASPSQQAATAIENEFFVVEANPDTSTFDVTDKTSGTIFRELNRFVDGGDRGDEYNYCPPETDRVVDAPAAPPIIRLVESGPARQTLQIEMIYRLPAALTADRDARADEIIELPIVTQVSLSPGVRRVDVQTTVDNQARDHRLRVHFPTPIHTDFSHAEGHFDVVTRPVDLPANTEGWSEQPMPTHPQRTFVDVNDGEQGLMAINRGLPEYEVLRGATGATIALTLLRCVEWLSRDDLVNRPGHAGPGLSTPGAQWPGRHVFEYALVPHTGDWRACFWEAHAFNAQLRAVFTGTHRGDLPSAGSFVTVEPDTVVVSAVKAAETGDGFIVRIYNVGDEPVEGRLRLWRPFKRATLVNLNEEELEELDVPGESAEIVLAMRMKQIVSVKLT
jgi:mannosylglycerate hydrolase